MKRPLALLLIAALVAAFAGAAPSPALLPAAIGLAAVTVGALAVTEIAARRIAVTRVLSSREAREGAPIRVTLAVARLGRLPVMVEARGGDGRWRPLQAEGGRDRAAAGGVPWAEGGRDRVVGVAEIVVPRRGAYVLAPTALRVRDRLGIAARALTAGRPEPLLILPAPAAVAARAAPAAAVGGDPEPDGLQAYVPGIPVSRIHWPSLARGSGLHARRLAAVPQKLPLIVVDTSRAAADGIDWAARATAGYAAELSRSGGCRVLLPGDRNPTTVADAAALHALTLRLALLAPAPPSPAPPGALLIAASAAPAAPRPPLPFGVEAA